MRLSVRNLLATSALVAFVGGTGAAQAVDLEVTHWWTSGGEAAAVAVLAEALDATGDHWVDTAIAGGGDTARPIIVSRIIGGDPPEASQVNNLTQVKELAEEGLLLDLADLAEKDGWADIVNPPKLLDACRIDDHVYCVPINIHSWQWMWLNRHVFEDNGMAVPTDWFQFVEAAPKLKEAGIIPLATGDDWQLNGARGVLTVAIAGPAIVERINGSADLEAAGSPEMLKVFEAFGAIRDLIDPGYSGRLWQEATAMVIEGRAAAQIMGDWAQGEFAVAEQVAGTDYDCLPGLGVHQVLDAGGDVFIFPKQDDPEVEAAQLRLASLLISPEVQVAFNLKKGSLPIRGDIDMSAANPCMQKGLEILKNPENVLTSGNVVLTEDTVQRHEDLIGQFFADSSMTAEEAQAEYVRILSEN